jgi:hypothetical protein
MVNYIHEFCKALQASVGRLADYAGCNGQQLKTPIAKQDAAFLRRQLHKALI